MASRKPVCAPTNAPLPDSLRVPSATSGLARSLCRLSKTSLIDLALEWLEEDNQTSCAPYLASNRNLEEELDEDYLWSPSETLEELRLTYNRMRRQTRVGRRSTVDRILDGDWRRGLSLYQLATIDFRLLAENDEALRWTALKLVPQGNENEDGQEPLKKRRKTDPALYPTISPTTFLRNLQQEIAPLVKAHYSLHRLRKHRNLPIIRICVTELPYANPSSSGQSPSLFTDATRLIFIALPDSCPYVYVSVSGTTTDFATKKKQPSSAASGTVTLKQTVLEEIPKALSKSQNRYSLESTCLTARSLSAMLALRGNYGANAANGFYSIFGKGIVDNGPIDPDQPTFAQKIIATCQEGEKQGSDLSSREALLNARQEAIGYKVLAERSANLPVTQNPKMIGSSLDPKILAATRFGVTGLPTSTPGYRDREPPRTHISLDRLHIRLDEDVYLQAGGSPLSHLNNNAGQDANISDQHEPSYSASADARGSASGRLTLTFQGSDIFLGLRRMFESGAINPDRLPNWMTGEEAVSGGTVRDGIVVQGKGSGA